MTKINLYLHIGYPKTGSTSIQQSLRTNRDELMNLGVLFPQTGIYNGGHHLIMAALENSEREISHWVPFEKNPDNYLIDLKREIENAKVQNIIISSEDFSLFEDIKNVKEYFEPYRVKIILYLRRQDEYLDSRFRHIIQNANIQHDSFNIPDYLFRQLDYKCTIERWAEAFGEENIDIIPFDKKEFKDHHIQTFLKHVGLNVSMNINTKMLNKTLTQVPIRFKIHANKMGLSKSDNQLLRTGLSGMPTDNLKPYILHSKIRHDILNKYEQDNSDIAKKYLGIESGKLFNNGHQITESSFTDHELSMAEMAQITTWLYVVLAKKLNSYMDVFSRTEETFNIKGLKLSQLEQSVFQQKIDFDGIQKDHDKYALIIKNLQATVDSLKGELKEIEQLTSSQSTLALQMRLDLTRTQYDDDKRDLQIKKTKHALDSVTKNLRDVKQLIQHQSLSTFKHSRKSIYKRCLRALRHPFLNERKLLIKSGMVDFNYYWKNYPQTLNYDITAAAHYVKYGAQEGKNPSEKFNTTAYLTRHPDAAKLGINPLVHFILEKRRG